MRRARERLVLLALSVGAHVLVLGWLMMQRQSASPAQEPPVMQVLLAPFPSATRQLPRRAPSPRPRSAQASAPALVQPQLVVPSTDAAAPGEARPAPSPALRRALRGLIGCRMAELSNDERQRCEQRFAARDGAAAPRLNLDARGDFARERDPYLARRARQGCKARAGGDADPAGEQGAAIGVGCAWAF